MGGVQMSAERLVTALVRIGTDVLVVCPRRNGVAGSSRHQVGARLVVIELPADERWSLLRHLKPWRRRVQAAVESLEAGVVHGQGLLQGGIAAADIRGIPSVVTAHGNVAADTNALYSGLGGIARSWLRHRLSIGVVERADVVIGINPDWTVNLPRRPRRFLYIPNIVDEHFFALNRQPEPARVLFAGGARAIKGWPLLATAWPSVHEAVPEARLHLVGWSEGQAAPEVDAPHRGTLSAEGWLSTEELAARMARASVLVIPSQFEVSPIVLGEAWALGLPVVATPAGGLRALAEGAAVVVPKREPEALAAGIVRALAGGEEIERLVEEGRRRAEAHQAEAVARAHLALYTELVQQAGG
jgi:glycosyltransferase involved in cell wall biosynthesis